MKVFSRANAFSSIEIDDVAFTLRSGRLSWGDRDVKSLGINECLIETHIQKRIIRAGLFKKSSK